MMEDWSSMNFIQSLNFTTANKKDLNKNKQGYFWIQTLGDKEGINWFVDTGSPRSFISRRTAQYLTKKLGHRIVKTDTNIKEFRCFNKNKIQVDYTTNWISKQVIQKHKIAEYWSSPILQ